MQLKQQHIDIIQRYFRQQPVKRAYLFGSYAKAEADANSDVDILVDLEYKEGIGLLFIEMQLALEDLLKKKVDLVSTKALSKHIAPLIEKDKRLIYEK